MKPAHHGRKQVNFVALGQQGVQGLLLIVDEGVPNEPGGKLEGRHQIGCRGPFGKSTTSGSERLGPG